MTTGAGPAFPSHTPTPWKVDAKAATRIASAGDRTVASTGGYGGAESLEENQANAAFIVRACNSHDDLCKAVDAALGLVRGEGPPNWDWLREVLKRART